MGSSIVLTQSPTKKVQPKLELGRVDIDMQDRLTDRTSLVKP